MAKTSQTTFNERKTEKIVRDILTKLGYEKDKDIVIEEQKSDNPIVQKCLKSASKSGKGVGKPEFIIRSGKVKDLLIVIECKADTAKHESKNKDKFSEYAVDGVLLYAEYLSREFNVIAIACSGETQRELNVSVFLRSKGSGESKPLLNKYNKKISTIIPFNEFADSAIYDKDVERKRYQDLLEFSRILHNYIRDYAHLSEAEKPLVVSGILIALSNKPFFKNYRDYDDNELPRELYDAIKREIVKAKMPLAKKESMISTYTFITSHTSLWEKNKKTDESPLFRIVSDIEENVLPFLSIYHNFDVVGQFYGEFLRYAGGDASLGIVLTPKHITELFAMMANLTPQSKVVDICAGTGGFLISSMMDMFRKCKKESEREFVAQNCLLGVESQPKMFALAASNMILRGDGKANLWQGSCFDEKIIKEIRQRKPQVGMINPPYSQKGEDLHEFNFVIQMLDSLIEGGIGLALLPISCAVQAHSLKKTLLKNHTLEAVMSLPEDLFHNVGAVPCIMVFKAHVPHNSNPHHKTWFGYWRNDGFEKTKNQGRIDIRGKWEDIRKKWLDSYFSRSEIPGLSVLAKVDFADEWCAEAYMQTDYSKLTQEDFLNEVRNYIVFRMKAG